MKNPEFDEIHVYQLENGPNGWEMTDPHKMWRAYRGEPSRRTFRNGAEACGVLKLFELVCFKKRSYLHLASGSKTLKDVDRVWQYQSC
jgi:hypothetical protein